MNRLEEIIKTLKNYIAEGVETALDFLEKILDHKASRYNDYIQIKSRYNSLQRELLLGVLDHGTYDISRNNISKALLLLAEEITENDLIPEGGLKPQEEDKRGEVLYNVPDLMQLNREEKCTVRIAFEADIVKRDWEASEEDVMKSIRVSEIMAVSLLNVDENDPPFVIRTLSETVQFVDKDDFTEWIFYVKPLKIGRFPLVMRVSVIEMINNKEYKKDIVLEEEITVETEVAPQDDRAAFKSAGAAITLTNTPLPPDRSAPEAVAQQVQQAGKKGFKRFAGALLTAVALAASGYFGYTFYEQENAWQKAGKGGKAADYEEYLKEYPHSRNSEKARQMIDSLNTTQRVDTLPMNTAPGSMSLPSGSGDSGTTSGQPADTSTIPNTTADRPSPGVANPNPSKPSKPAKPAPGKTKPSTPGKNPGKTKPNSPNTPTPPNTSAPGTTGSAPAPQDPAPATGTPAPAPLLRGEIFYFKIPRFPIVEGEEQNMYFTFFQFNQYEEVLAVLGILGETQLSPGMKLAFVSEKGNDLMAELKYVASTIQTSKRLDGYFNLKQEDLQRLSNEKFKTVRLSDASGKLIQNFTFSKRGSKELNRRAGEALKKLSEK